MCDGHEAPPPGHSRRRFFGAGVLALALWPLRQQLKPHSPDHPVPGPRPPRRPAEIARKVADPPPHPTPPPDPPPVTATPPLTSPAYGTPVPNRTITIEIPALPLPVPDGWAEQSLGTSHGGRPLQILVRHPTVDARARVLVVCGVHGNELGTVPIAQRLLSVPIPDDVLVAVMPALNPDGWAAQDRLNGVQVDLNRNFPWRWAPYDGGPGPSSEPEVQATMGLVQANPWDLTVWIHQPLGYVAAVPPSDRRFAEAWGAATGLPYREDLDQHGGGETWSAKVAGVPSMLVEVATHDVTSELVEAHAAGFAAALAQL